MGRGGCGYGMRPRQGLGTLGCEHEDGGACPFCMPGLSFWPGPHVVFTWSPPLRGGYSLVFLVCFSFLCFLFLSYLLGLGWGRGCRRDGAANGGAGQVTTLMLGVAFSVKAPVGDLLLALLDTPGRAR